MSDKCETCVYNGYENEYCPTCDGKTYYRATESARIAELERENTRLRELVKKAYFEADSTYWPDSNWNASKSKAALEGKDE